MSKLTAKEIKFYRTVKRMQRAIGRSYVNSNPLLDIGSSRFHVPELLSAAIASKAHVALIGERGCGKTVIAETIQRSIFGDKAFYLRGDPQTRVRDLVISLNLDGRTIEEIQGISEKINYRMALIDEANRVPGLIQNQYMGFIDGYVEINGVKHYFGNGYLYGVLTANPSGEHGGVGYSGAFEEDSAFLNRVPLFIMMDEIAPTIGDVFEIGMRNIDRQTIAVCDMEQDVVEAYKYLQEKKQDPEINVVLSLLESAVYGAFATVTIGGKEVRKRNGWRDALTGEHDAGTCIAYCSPVPVRNLENARRMAIALYEIARIEAQVKTQAGLLNEDDAQVGIREMREAYIQAVKFGLEYDELFLPTDVAQTQVNKSKRETIAAAFGEDLTQKSGVGDDDLLTNAAILAMEALDIDDNERVEKIIKSASGEVSRIIAHVEKVVTQLRDKRGGEKESALLLGVVGYSQDENLSIDSLICALDEGNEELFWELIEKNKIDLSKLSSAGGTIFMHAAAIRDFELMQELIDKGADINLAGKQGLNALHKAIDREMEDVVAFLIEKGVDVNKAVEIEGEEEITPLSIALDTENQRIIKLLKDAGAE